MSQFLPFIVLIVLSFLIHPIPYTYPFEEKEADLWNRTKELTQDTVKKAKELTQETLEEARSLLGREEKGKSEELWEKLLPKLESVLNLEDRHETLPDSALLSADKVSNQQNINELLDEAVNILVISPTQAYRKQIQDLEGDIREANRKIIEYEEKRVSAPRKKPLWKPWETTDEEYSQKIEELKERIARNQDEIKKTKESLQNELQNMGLMLTPEQLDFLLSTLVGDNIIQINVTFNNIKTVTQQLEQIMVKSGENVNIARRYYGMYVVLLEILDHMYQQLIQDIDQKYLPQIQGGKGKDGKEIKGIIPRTEVLLKQTEDLLKKESSDRNKEILTANLEAQKLTLEAAKLYKGYLEMQRTNMKVARQKLNPDISVAKNTYETVKVSSELIAMMKSSQNLFDTLKNLQIPELRVFENLEMKKEFEKLTIQLKVGGEG
ncbi:MAG TPA: hypothetical protein VNM22_18590 [Candidatus Limnocylindrales bacterium]|nr:hypothetical protein [Candidatus Limnocylindrales bacterium]